MHRFYRQVDEMPGFNYHEVAYKFNLADVIDIHETHINERYHSSCCTSPFKLLFSIVFEKVYTDNTYACNILLERTDDLPIPAKLSFTLNLTNFLGFAGPVFRFPETVIACGQQIQKSFHPVLDRATLLDMIGQPLTVKISFRFTDCHKDKRSRDDSPHSDEGCSRASKHGKF